MVEFREKIQDWEIAEDESIGRLQKTNSQIYYFVYLLFIHAKT